MTEKTAPLKYRTVGLALAANDMPEFRRMFEIYVKSVNDDEEKKQDFLDQLLDICLVQENLVAADEMVILGAKLPVYVDKAESLLTRSRMNIESMKWLKKQDYDLGFLFENGQNLAFIMIEDLYEQAEDAPEIFDRIKNDFRWLLQNTPSVIDYQDISGKNLLHFVAARGQLSVNDELAPARAELIVHELVRAGVNPKAEDARFCSPEEYIPTDAGSEEQNAAWNGVADLLADYRLGKIKVPTIAGQEEVFNAKMAAIAASKEPKEPGMKQKIASVISKISKATP